MMLMLFIASKGDVNINKPKDGCKSPNIDTIEISDNDLCSDQKKVVAVSDVKDEKGIGTSDGNVITVSDDDMIFISIDDNDDDDDDNDDAETLVHLKKGKHTHRIPSLPVCSPSRNIQINNEMSVFK